MIILDYKDNRPIYEQIIEKFEALILNDVLKKDEPMPSVRSLAVELSINPNTIQRAYAELEKAGWIYVIPGKGSFVAREDKAIEQKVEIWKKDLEKVLNQAKLINLSKKEIIDIVNIYVKE